MELSQFSYLERNGNAVRAPEHDKNLTGELEKSVT